MTQPIPSADTATGKAYAVSTHGHDTSEEAVETVMRNVNLQMSEWLTVGFKVSVESVSHRVGLDPFNGYFATAIFVVIHS